MNREQIAKNNHRSGYNCASAVYSAFSDMVSGSAPIPRGEGGKCGAVLAGEKALGQLGMNVEPFDEKFISIFGSLKCAELRHTDRSCNDFVGCAARLTEEIIEA